MSDESFLSNTAEPSQDNNPQKSPDLNRAVKELDIRISSGGSPLRVDKSMIYLVVFVGLFLFLSFLFYFGSVRPIELHPYDSDRRVDLPRLGVSLVPPGGYTRHPDILPRFSGQKQAYLEIAARSVHTYPQPKGKNSGIFTCVLFGRDVAERYTGEVVTAVPLKVGERHGGFVEILVKDGKLTGAKVYAWGVVIDSQVHEAVFVFPAGTEPLEREVMAQTAASLKATPFIMPTAKPFGSEVDEPHKPEKMP